MTRDLIHSILIIFLFGCNPQSGNEILETSGSFNNILFIISDDLATHAVGCYGNTKIRTPNIDRLSRTGVRFESAYANSPMCTPSRATIMTGKYPHAAGVTLLRTALPDSVTTISEILKTKGFATGVFGKTHFNSQLKHGFDTLVNNQHHQQYLKGIIQPSHHDSIRIRPKWKPFRDHARIWLNAEGATSGNYFEHSQGTYFAQAAIDFIRKHKNERFFAVASFREPHSPFNFAVEYQGRHPPSTFEIPTASEEDQRWVPKVFSDLTQSEKQGITSSYYSSVEYMDRNVGLLLDELDRLELSRQTLVVFVGDHGYLLNHHGRFEKHMMWEESVTTPLIIRGYRNDATVTTAVELVDLAPTMLTALGFEPTPSMQGKALQGLLEGIEDSHREYTFSEYLTDNKAMLTDGKWKYIFTSGKRDLGSGYQTGFGPSGISHRLYNLESDPYETNNLADLPEYKNEVNRFQQALISRFRETHPYSSQISEEATIEAQLIQYCEPPEGEDIGSF